MYWVLAGGVLLMLLFPTKTWGYVAGEPVELELAGIGGGHKLRADAAGAFLEMDAAARLAGVPLQVNSAFRTLAEQQRLFELSRAGGATAAAPGWSNHQGGIAVDIETAGATNRAFTWLTANAARFRFRRTVSSEPWHWEYRP